MDLALAGKHAVVTGASRGIGLSIAQHLASEGCHVTLVARDEGALSLEMSRINENHPGNAICVVADLGNPNDIERMWDLAGTPDILVNNAGDISRGTLSEVGDEQLRREWDVKLFGYIHNCRIAFPRMCERGSGVIINVIGTAANHPRPDFFAGAGANAALAAITRTLGANALQSGVRVVGVNPGHICTQRMTRRLENEAQSRFGDSTRWRELLAEEAPVGEASHVAALVTFLASDRAAFCNGAVYVVDGGLSFH